MEHDIEDVYHNCFLCDLSMVPIKIWQCLNVSNTSQDIQSASLVSLHMYMNVSQELRRGTNDDECLI